MSYEEDLKRAVEASRRRPPPPLRPNYARVAVNYAEYRCGNCATVLRVTPMPSMPSRSGEQQYIKGFCGNADCKMANVQLRIPILKLTCEILV